VVEAKKDFAIDSQIAAAYDSYLPSFAIQIPALAKAYDATPGSSPLKAKLAEQMAMLRKWDFRWGVSSIETSLAQYWGEEIGRRVNDEVRASGMGADDYIAQKAAPAQLVEALSAASDRLAADFGTWKTPWGEINRYQRVNGDIVQKFDDGKPSIPVGFTSSRWGSLASFGART